MILTASVPVSKVLSPAAWVVEVEPHALSQLGGEPDHGGNRSLISVSAAELSPDIKLLEFPVADAVVYNIGSTKECIVVLLEGDTVTRKPEVATVSRSQVSATADQPLRKGDQAFLNACRQENLPDSMIGLARSLLEEIRSYSNDDLYEGQSRKWVTKPNNFLALTIQNRNKRFTVHVKHTKGLDTLDKILDIKADRAPYSRFFLEKASQLPAVLQAIRLSYQVSNSM